MGINEKNEYSAMARLARNGVLGLRYINEGAVDIKQEAVRRLMSLTKNSASQARHEVEQMLRVLKGARLTINLNANNWFSAPNLSASLQNHFERPVENDPGGQAYRQKRDAAEMRQNGYGGGISPVAGPPNLAEWQVQTQISRYATMASPDFSPTIRPRYGAMDFLHHPHGGTGLYGRYGLSFFVLKEHLKHVATYVHDDSFKKVEDDLTRRSPEYGGKLVSLYEATATYFQLEKVLLYCQIGTLQQIYRQATGSPLLLCLPPTSIGGKQSNYIEFQLHSEIQFGCDVEKMVVALREFDGTPLKNTVRRNIEAFTARHGIKLEYVVGRASPIPFEAMLSGQLTP